jgi:hypothetical protein
MFSTLPIYFWGAKQTNLGISKLPGFKDPDAWTQLFTDAFMKPADINRREVERVLFLFVDANRCLFPELCNLNLQGNIS